MDQMHHVATFIWIRDRVPVGHVVLVDIQVAMILRVLIGQHIGGLVSQLTIIIKTNQNLIFHKIM